MHPDDNPPGGPPGGPGLKTYIGVHIVKPHEPPPAVPVSPDDDKPGVPNPATGEPGPPGTVAWQGNTPVDGVGQSMRDYHAARKDRPATPGAEPAAVPASPPG